MLRNSRDESSNDATLAQDLLNAALRYADLGYLVFPLAPGTSKPLTKHGFHDASSDADQIERWWSRHPNANIGLATQGLVVIDLDPLEGGKLNGWPHNPDKALDLAGAGAVATTPRGGKHYYFRQPAGRNWRCTTSQLASHVDTRADGGYAVVPPSKRPDGTYSWAPDLALDVPLDKLPEPPGWLVEELDRLASPSDGKAKASAEASEAGEIREKRRNNTLFRIGCSMRRHGLSLEQILKALSTINAEACKPPLPAAEVERIAKSAAGYAPEAVPGELEPDIQCLADVEARAVPWLWPCRIPSGRLTLLVGRPSAGKSLLTCDLAARITTGGPWPDPGFDRAPLGDVLLVCAEDDAADTIKPRLIQAGADCRRVHLLRAAKVREVDGREREVAIDLANIDVIRDALARLPECRLLVFDPLGHYIGSRVDTNTDCQVRAVLGPLAQLAAEHEVAVLLVCHTRKAGAAFADDMVLGSRGFVGLARAVWHLATDPADKARRLLLPGKCNLAPPSAGLAFRIVSPGRLEWEPTPLEGLHADDVMAAPDRPSRAGPDADALAAATDWLQSALANGPRLVKELADEWCNGEGGSKRTLHRAKQSLQVEAFRPEVPGPWWWRLPPNIAKNP
jgi:hypothetical protein